MIARPDDKRRRADRSADMYVRRQTGAVRHLHSLSSALPSNAERRRSIRDGFDVAAVLELNLKTYPSKTGMLTLLQSWLYAAEANGLQIRWPEYVAALTIALQVMGAWRDPAQAITVLQKTELTERSRRNSTLKLETCAVMRRYPSRT